MCIHNDKTASTIIYKLAEIKHLTTEEITTKIVREWIQEHVEELKELGIDPPQIAKQLYEKKRQEKKEREVEFSVSKLFCAGVVYGNWMMGFHLTGHRGRYEFDFDDHIASKLDFSKTPCKSIRANSGEFTFDFDPPVLIKSKLVQSSDVFSNVESFPRDD